MSSFKDLRIVDNFYQTSAFFPMPTVCISTMNPDGSAQGSSSQQLKATYAVPPRSDA